MSGPMTPAGYEMLQIPTSPATGDVLKRTSAAAISGCLRQGGSNPVPVARPLEDYEAAEKAHLPARVLAFSSRAQGAVVIEGSQPE